MQNGYAGVCAQPLRLLQIFMAALFYHHFLNWCNEDFSVFLKELYHAGKSRTN
jgi:hypothetical protein